MNVEKLTPGTVVGGRYVIDGFLARGGFASVYRAHHQQIGRRLAIKVLDPPARNAVGDSFRERFVAEAKLAAKIEHPGVVSVFDFGMLDDGRAFIAMDLLDGHDLETELENGAIDAARFLPMFIDCLAALAQGHRQGIVHKDLKPSNLFIVGPGKEAERLVVLDFGIARSFDDPGARVTQEGGFAGTPAYLAPEYIRHQLITPAIDVYQMGLILIESLTGAPAVKANSSMGYLLAHCLEPVTLPTSLIETRLGAICLKAVAKEPEDRFADAVAFREALINVPRADLLKTTRFVVDRPAPSGEQEAAKTLQFIPISPEALQQLSGPLRAPPAVVDEPVADEDGASETTTLQLLLAAAVLLVAVAAAAFMLVGLDSETPDPPTESLPASTPRTPVEVVDMGTAEPKTPLVVPDVGRADSSSEFVFEPDLGAAVAQPEPPPPKVRPMTRPEPKPIRVRDPEPRPKPDKPKPVKPLLLSP